MGMQVDKQVDTGRFERSKGGEQQERREGKGDEVASGVRTIIFATKATSARPQSEINSSRGLLTLSIIPLAIRARYKYRRVKPTVFPTSQTFSLADSKSEYRMAFPDKPSRSIFTIRSNFIKISSIPIYLPRCPFFNRHFQKNGIILREKVRKINV